MNYIYAGDDYKPENERRVCQSDDDGQLGSAIVTTFRLMEPKAFRIGPGGKTIAMAKVGLYHSHSISSLMVACVASRYHGLIVCLSTHLLSSWTATK